MEVEWICRGEYCRWDFQKWGGGAGRGGEGKGLKGPRRRKKNREKFVKWPLARSDVTGDGVECAYTLS